ncbi:helix-turn-helix domain-containing protein [Paenibacillus senegalimassiliensis]|uniref:hypothetical protein n=1 Tax=Paenibacillus senegalimassiliensis TaxID=1737426 RepID=UPI00073E404A|nr:hypothetical protein [Paenibacillus senegalimassiliensis]
MFKNLRAEMARKKVSVGELAAVLGVRYATASEKLNGHSRFYYEEATKIRKHFFPECQLEYLFEQSEYTKTG